MIRRQLREHLVLVCKKEHQILIIPCSSQNSSAVQLSSNLGMFDGTPLAIHESDGWDH